MGLFRSKKENQENRTQKFRFMDKVVQVGDFPRTGVVLDGCYEVGELCSIDSWRYRVKWDDGEFETVRQINLELLTNKNKPTGKH